MEKLSVYLDTDVGFDSDDAWALALAAKSLEIELLGVGTVCHDAVLRQKIAQRILSLAGAYEIPVAAGRSPTLMQRLLQ